MISNTGYTNFNIFNLSFNRVICGLIFTDKYLVCEISGSHGGEYERRFRDAYCLHHQGEECTSVNTNLTTRRYIPEDSKLP
jgi:hypothetical protein